MCVVTVFVCTVYVEVVAGGHVGLLLLRHPSFFRMQSPPFGERGPATSHQGESPPPSLLGTINSTSCQDKFTCLGQMLEMTRNSISPSFNTLPAPPSHSCMGSAQPLLAVTGRILTVLARSGYLLSAIPGVRGSPAFYSNVYLMTSLNRIQIYPSTQYISVASLPHSPDAWNLLIYKRYRYLHLH